MYKILISSAGRRVGLVQSFRNSAASLGVDLEVHGADMNPGLSSACQRCDRLLEVPECSDPAFASRLLEYCTHSGISLLIPTIDTELAVFAERRSEFEKCGVSVVVSDAFTVGVARDKMRTASVLSSAGVVTPVTLSVEDYARDPNRIGWPIVIKPISGSSSIGIVFPSTREEAIKICTRSPGSIVQDRWTGREYTMNMYVDRGGVLRCAIPHWRIESRGGEVSKGRTEDVGILRSVAKRICSALPGIRGPICVQAFVTSSGQYAVFEINARFGGGYPLAHHAGATFTQWLLEEALCLPCSAHDNWRPGVTMLRYDDAVFLET